MQIHSSILSAPSNGPRSFGSRLVDIIKLATPAALTMMSYSMVGLVDTLMVGHLGATALAAVGLSNTLLYTLSALVLGLVGAVTPLTAQHEGAGQKEEAGQYLHQAIWLAIIGGVVLGLGVFLGANLILTLMQPGDDVVVLGTRYLHIRAVGFPLFYLIVARDHFLEGLGDTRTPMKVSLIVNVVNAALNYLLIHAPLGLPSFGVEGSAWATVIAHGLSALYYSRVIRRVHTARPEYKMLPLQPPKLEALRHMVKVGWPMSIQFSLDIGAWLVMTVFMAWMGTHAQAANQVTLRILSVTFMTIHGVSIAATALVGQHLGAGQVQEARRYAYAALVVGLGVTGINAAAYLLVPELLTGIFTKDPAVLALAATLLAIGAVIQVVDTLTMVSYGALKGAGDTRFPMFVAIGTSWGIGLPLAWVLAYPLGLGAPGVYYALIVQLVVSSVLNLRRLAGDQWQLSALVETAQIPPVTEESETTLLDVLKNSRANGQPQTVDAA